MGEKGFKFQIRLVDSQTGEIISVSNRVHTMFCNGDGEKYLKSWFDCFVRGLRERDNLCVEIVAGRIVCVEFDFPVFFSHVS